VIMASGARQKYPKQDVERMIKEHGGSIHQSYSKIPDIVIVYGGIVKNVPVQSIIKNDVHSIIKPEWIVDCIEQKHVLPLEKKYYFHATEETQEAEECNDIDTEGDQDLEQARSTKAIPKDAQSQAQEDEGGPETEDEGIDSDSWLHVPRNEKEGLSTSKEQFRESAPERESDTESDGGLTEGEDMDEAATDEFELVTHPVEDEDGISQYTSKMKVADDVPNKEDVMGETDDAMVYDTEQIFTHLCFYIDTSENARKNGFSIENPTNDQGLISQELQEVRSKIERNGGRITKDLNHSKLTHVVLHKRDLSRRRELEKRTREPKRRNLVVHTWIQCCLDEDTLLNEAFFAP